MVAMKTIHAVYEKGVFRPLGAVQLPERAEVEFEPRLVGKESRARLPVQLLVGVPLVPELSI